MPVICCFGDSITYGMGDTDLQSGWVGRLATYFPDLSFVNLGVCGDTVQGLSQRVSSQLDKFHPDIALFSFGVNDSSYAFSGDPQIPLSDFIGMYEQILLQVKDSVSSCVVLGLTPYDASKVFPWNFLIDDYDRAIQDICARLQLLYVPLFDVLTLDDFDDGLHPNALGYQKMFERIEKYIRPLVA